MQGYMNLVKVKTHFSDFSNSQAPNTSTFSHQHEKETTCTLMPVQKPPNGEITNGPAPTHVPFTRNSQSRNSGVPSKLIV